MAPVAVAGKGLQKERYRWVMTPLPLPRPASVSNREGKRRAAGGEAGASQRLQGPRPTGASLGSRRCSAVQRGGDGGRGKSDGLLGYVTDWRAPGRNKLWDCAPVGVRSSGAGAFSIDRQVVLRVLQKNTGDFLPIPLHFRKLPLQMAVRSAQREAIGPVLPSTYSGPLQRRAASFGIWSGNVLG